MNKQSVKQKKIKIMYENLNKLLPKDKIDLLKQYFSAISNFYLLIPLKNVFEIINSQNDECFSEEAFLAFAELVQTEENEHYYVVGKDEFYDDMPECQPMEMELAHEKMLMFEEDYYDLSEAKEGKSYYIPDKNELLKYTDECYMPESDQHNAMSEFIKKHVSSKPENISSLMFELFYAARRGETSFEAIEDIGKLRNISHFTRNYDEFEALYIDFFNNTRNPYLNGYSPTEYFQLCNDRDESMYIEKYDMTKEERALKLSEIEHCSEDFLDTLDNLKETFSNLAPDTKLSLPAPTVVKKVKIGRNDPCPCGSGKKYKKCCGA